MEKACRVPTSRLTPGGVARPSRRERGLPWPPSSQQGSDIGGVLPPGLLS